MKEYDIPLESLIAKSILRNGDTGKVSLNLENGEIRMLTLVEGLSKKHQNYAYIPERFKLPFRIDITLKANSPAFKLSIGKGHIMFAGSLNRGGFGMRRADILTGREESTKYDYDNALPIGEYVKLSVVYGNEMTWVEINGRHCYHTGKAPYMAILKSGGVPEEFKNGFGFAIACGENVELLIKSLRFTEYGDGGFYVPEEIAKMPELSAFEWYLKSLPHEIRGEVLKTDEYLMNYMKLNLKFKKSVDKDGKLTYDSPCGLRYSMNRFGIGETHTLSWNRFGDVLNKLAETSPEFADRMFANIDESVSGRGGEKCRQCTVISCANMKATEYDGETRRSCGGSMHFKWLSDDFADVRRIVAAAGGIAETADKSR